jgi:hypothetical protein
MELHHHLLRHHSNFFHPKDAQTTRSTGLSKTTHLLLAKELVGGPPFSQFCVHFIDKGCLLRCAVAAGEGSITLRKLYSHLLVLSPFQKRRREHNFPHNFPQVEFSSLLTLYTHWDGSHQVVPQAATWSWFWMFCMKCYAKGLIQDWVITKTIDLTYTQIKHYQPFPKHIPLLS